MYLRQQRGVQAFLVCRRAIIFASVVGILLVWLLYPSSSTCSECETHLNLRGIAFVPSGSAIRNAYSRRQIGVLLVATQLYVKFARDMISSARHRLLPEHDVHFYVWTDANATHQSWASDDAHIHFISQAALGWPFDSLGRNHIYYRDRHLWASMDYVFAIDSDVLFVGVVGDEVLGDRVAALSAWFYRMPGNSATYETRTSVSGEPLSTAFVPQSDRRCYYAGGWFGGRREQMLHMLKTIASRITADLMKSPPVIALWHDESQINKYFVDFPPTHVLSPGFLFPERDGDAKLWTNQEVWGSRKAPLVTAVCLNTGVRKAFLSNENIIRPTAIGIPQLLMDASQQGGALPEIRAPATAYVDMTLDVTFAVKTFERPECLRRLIASIPRRFQNVRVLIVDDSKEPLANPPASPYIEYHWVGYDVGLSAGRNELVRLVQTDYMLLLDDDFIFNDKTRIEWLLDVARSGTADIVAGCIEGEQSSFALERPFGRSSLLRVSETVRCNEVAANAGYQIAYSTEDFTCWCTDMVSNFFLASKAALQRVMWDPRLKLGEHEDFFMRAKQNGLRVATCSGVQVANDHACLPKATAVAYADKRARVFDYWVYMFQKWGLEKMQTEAGEYRLVCGSDGSCKIAHDQKDIWWNKH